MFLNIHIDLLILKTYYGQFTLTTKKSLHIIFNASAESECNNQHVLHLVTRSVVDSGPSIQ